MNPQFFIIITPEKERELFDFILEECNGVIFGPSATCFEEDKNLCEYVDKNNIESHKYFISYKHLHDNQIIDSHSLYFEDNCCVLIDRLKFSLLEDKFHNAPYIEYERFEKANRIYVNYSGMTKKSKHLISPLYETIKKWVKKHAVKTSKSDIVKAYIIQ